MPRGLGTRVETDQAIMAGSALLREWYQGFRLAIKGSGVHVKLNPLPCSPRTVCGIVEGT